MKKANVQIGSVYAVKVSDKIAPVRISHESPNGGWWGRSMTTYRSVRIKTAQRLRHRIPNHPDERTE